MRDGEGVASQERSYLSDPEAIYEASFAAIRREIALEDWPASLHPMVLRLVHASGMPEIVPDLRFEGEPARSAREALERGTCILADAAMVRAGINSGRLPRQNDVVVTIGDERVPGAAARGATTRSAAAVDLWPLEGAVVAIGNAPTALFRLIERLEAGAPRPAAIFAFPVGFVGAAESKAALVEADLGIPFMTLVGRRGGSAMAAAAINAVSTTEQ